MFAALEGVVAVVTKEHVFAAATVNTVVALATIDYVLAAATTSDLGGLGALWVVRRLASTIRSTTAAVIAAAATGAAAPGLDFYLTAT